MSSVFPYPSRRRPFAPYDPNAPDDSPSVFSPSLDLGGQDREPSSGRHRRKHVQGDGPRGEAEGLEYGVAEGAGRAPRDAGRHDPEEPRQRRARKEATGPSGADQERSEAGDSKRSRAEASPGGIGQCEAGGNLDGLRRRSLGLAPEAQGTGTRGEGNYTPSRIARWRRGFRSLPAARPDESTATQTGGAGKGRPGCRHRAEWWPA